MGVGKAGYNQWKGHRRVPKLLHTTRSSCQKRSPLVQPQAMQYQANLASFAKRKHIATKGTLLFAPLARGCMSDQRCSHRWMPHQSQAL